MRVEKEEERQLKTSKARVSALSLVALVVVGPGLSSAGDVVVDSRLVSTATSVPPLEVSSSELVTNLNADQLDGMQGLDLPRHPPRILLVAPSGGDFASIQVALDSISDAGDTNRYLIRVGPGTYTERVTMKQYVNIEGAGEALTKITSPGSPDTNTATVVGADDAELRFLSVENTGGDLLAIGILASGVSPRLFSLEVVASGGDFNEAIRASFSSPQVEKVTATAIGGAARGVHMHDGTGATRLTDVNVLAKDGTSNVALIILRSSPILVGITATAQGAGFQTAVSAQDNSSVTVRDSILVGSSALSISSSVTASVAASQLIGLLFGTGFSCVGAYDGSYTALDSGCAPPP